MKIEVLANAGFTRLPYLENKLVVVIDVLRATSTMVTALANGCQAIIPVSTPEEALERRLTLPGSLLGGERQALPIEGFDLSNSPFDYVPEKVGGKRVIMTAANATRAIRESNAAPMILMASFVNMQSIVSVTLHRLKTNHKYGGIVIFCTGTEEQFDLPDTLCAGMLIDSLGINVELNDLGTAARILYRGSEDHLANMIRESDHGQRLLSLGLEQDLIYCSTPNILPIIPVYEEGEIAWLITK